MFATTACLTFAVLSIVLVANHGAAHTQGWQRLIPPWLRAAPTVTTWDAVPTISLDLNLNLDARVKTMLQSRLAPPTDVRRLLWLRLARIDQTVVDNAAIEIGNLLDQKTTPSPKDTDQIDLDLARVETPYGTESALRRILIAYAVAHKEINYIQSIGHIVGALLHVFVGDKQIEPKVFALFTHIMRTHRRIIYNIDNRGEELYGQDKVIKAVTALELDRRSKTEWRTRLSGIGIKDVKAMWSSLYLEQFTAIKAVTTSDQKLEWRLIVIDNYLAFGFKYLVSLTAALIVLEKPLMDDVELEGNCQISPATGKAEVPNTCVSTIMKILIGEPDFDANNWLEQARLIRIATRSWKARFMGEIQA